MVLVAEALAKAEVKLVPDIVAGFIGKRPAAVFRTSAPFPPAKSVVFAGCATCGNATPTGC
jgi:hypothetical protein